MHGKGCVCGMGGMHGKGDMRSRGNAWLEIWPLQWTGMHSCFFNNYYSTEIIYILKEFIPISICVRITQR